MGLGLRCTANERRIVAGAQMSKVIAMKDLPLESEDHAQAVQEGIELSSADWAVLVAALENPAPVNDRLARAFRAHRQAVKSQGALR